MKKKIDAQRRQENTLYEKSKELALKLRDKAKDEKRKMKKNWEQFIKMIIIDSPLIRDTDIMRDARETPSDIYEEILLANNIKEDSENINIFTVSFFYRYFLKSTQKRVLTIKCLSLKQHLIFPLTVVLLQATDYLLTFFIHEQK